jgi:multicomponent Na+:H+ antiporter subunit E
MSSPGGAPNGLTFHVLARAAALLILWLVLAGSYPADLPVGLVAVFAATLTSLRLFPPDRSSGSPVALVRLVLRFLCQSAVAGADVAWRALDPRLPLRTGFVLHPVRFPPGSARNTFAALTSLLPGTVPAGERNGQIIYHCLDIDQPVVAQLAAEEAALARAMRDD